MAAWSEDRIPILVGGGQVTQRDVEPAEALEPLRLMATAAERAADDAWVRIEALAELDLVAVVNILGWSYANPPGALAAHFQASPRQLWYSTLGGNTPQWLVNEIAARIAAGEVRFALLAGAEALATQQRARRAKVPLQWSTGEAPSQPNYTLVGSNRPGANDVEMSHGMTLPVVVYPLFENALRVHYGHSLEEHRRYLGEFCARMAAVAATHPNAWFPVRRSAEEIATPSKENRLVSYPYTKYMNAIMEVDQGAALLLTSVACAKKLGIPPERWVYLCGCADTQDHWFVSERVNYWSSPAIRVATREALRMAGWTVHDIDFFDLYSCFPCAVQIGRDALGIPKEDGRALTVTGGLPYFGGPGNNYVTHSIATMLGVLRRHPGKRGLVTGLGWYITKHSVGVYSTEAPPRPFVRRDPSEYQQEIDCMARPEVVLRPRGRGKVETYTIVHDRDGTPVRGVVIGRLPDGHRFLANLRSDPKELALWEERELIGVEGEVRAEDPVNVFLPD
ncbi:MAG: acetyl-CoA acetyltransferase [Candidatus Binatia bacterium]|nr:MAG: acetyl-CoA acetyltransferase [Candidatus Binatia bacterium]